MKKHILIVSQYFYPEQFRINDMACEWVKRGYRVTVLTGIPNYPQGKFYQGYGWFKRRKESWNGIDIIRIPLIARGHSSIGMVMNYLSFVVSGFFWKCFTKIKADYVFTFEVSPMTQALVGVWYAKRRKIPHYLYVQDLWPENVEIVTGIHTRAVIGPIEKMVKYIYRKSDRVLATSPSFVREIQKRIPDEAEKVSYWPQYAEDFYRRGEARSELIPQDGKLNVTFTGNIGTAQGLEILPKTATLLKSMGANVRFNIVGDGRNKERLTKEITDAGVSEYFNMIDRRPAEEMPAILAASDVAFLSFADNRLYSMTIPAKLQSYMACACPILAVAEGETRRIVTEAECGVCTPFGDAEALAQAIMRLTREELEQMGRAAEQYFKNHFDKKTLMDDLERYF